MRSDIAIFKVAINPQHHARQAKDADFTLANDLAQGEQSSGMPRLLETALYRYTEIKIISRDE